MNTGSVRTAAVAPPANDTRPVLRRRTIGPLQLVGLAVAVALVTAALFAVTPLQGRADFLVVLYLLYLAGQTALSFWVEGGRSARNRLAVTLIGTSVVVAVIPLAAVLIYTVAKGLKVVNVNFLIHSMRGVGPLDRGGGIYHSMLGTLEQVLLASLISIPFGLLTAIYIVEYGRGRLARAIRFFVDVMTGIPSIVAGLFIFAFWVIGLGKGFSGFAAALSLAILMLPVIVRASEEMLRLVPDDLREASYALGVPRWRTILKVVLPTASTGITTGIMLAIARVTGETAPLLLTAFGFDSIKTNPFDGQQSGLPLYIFDQAGRPQQFAVDRAWGAALVLIVFVLVLYVIARLATRRNRLVNA